MSKTIKGSLAAIAAAIVLLGGLGSLAYWNDSENLPGATVSSGRLDLGTPACGEGWLLDGGTVYKDQKIVPGDTLTKTCTIDLTATGAHLGADLGISTPTWSGAKDPTASGLIAELTPTAVFLVNEKPKTHITSADDIGTGEIVATLTINFDGRAATNASQNLTAVLQTIAITATQTHDAS
jgi:alternate signal-mediated exported protein